MLSSTDINLEVQDLKENIPFYPIISLLGHFCSTASIFISEKQAATSCSLQLVLLKLKIWSEIDEFDVYFHSSYTANK